MEKKLDIDRYHQVDEELFSHLKKKDKPAILVDCSFGHALSEWTLDYLTRTLGEQRVTIHESPDQSLEFIEKNFKYKTCTFKEFSERLQDSSSNIYFRSTSSSLKPAKIEEDFPVIAKDLKPPDFIPYGKGNQLYHSSILRIASQDIQIWTHFDLYDNVLCQVVGTKRIILIPPEDSKHLYVEGDKSRINCFDNWDACRERFPLVDNARIYVCHLKPGESLFIPALWWHNIKSVRETTKETYTISFNIFWRDQELAHRSLYAERDVYGNKNLVPFDAALTNVNKAIQHLNKLPGKYNKFYKQMLLQCIQKKLISDDE